MTKRMAIVRTTLEELRKRKSEILKGLKPVPDEEIDFSDIPEIDLDKLDPGQVNEFKIPPTYDSKVKRPT